ncbi:glycoside hydrolase family 127 protein [Petrotoga halophila]|uniref:Arabinosidase n=1 Tax=Petrotoga halophila DSM 16923 TaxID=1122953 RepID=A0A2S5EJU8_9BACT|nr:beta-L-arabinofuranosidase domain-containing protein [Petrotoga halophila]POZ93411.1 arabinosidase [Petrotoga halophila DSM 16923]
MDETKIINFTNSSKNKLTPCSISSVKIKGFMNDYLETMLKVTIPSQYELLESTGRIDNFRIASGKKEGSFKGLVFNDSDVYKWLEAASYALLFTNDDDLKEKIDNTIKEVKDAQEDNGYLNTYFMFERKKERWTDLATKHELYCAGHLIQAAIAHKRVTGEDTLFDVAIKFADLIVDTFGPDKKRGAPGHPEIEMALVELYRETKNQKYLNLAKYFLEERGNGYASTYRFFNPEYYIDHKPFKELDEMTGHAVRMLYLCTGATDIYLETGDEEIFSTIERLWENLVTKKMYITGGAGSRYEGESFGEDYELPNRRAYTETCAAIASYMWNYRMFLVTGEGKYVDLMELVLYNGLLSGISIDGKHYFYVNPLEDRGKKRRQPWYECACCPPNISRTLTSFPGYIYTTSDEGVYINLYENSQANIIYKEKEVKITQETDYPWDGKIRIIVSTEVIDPFSLFLRIPSWANVFDITVDGEKLNKNLEKGFLKIFKPWKGPHEIILNLPMDIKFVESHPFVRENLDKVALKRGPMVYCIEKADNKEGDVWNYLIDLNEKIEPENYQINSKRVIKLKAKGYHEDIQNWEGRLYSQSGRVKGEKKKIDINLIPYFAWANREEGPMAVWIRK